VTHTVCKRPGDVCFEDAVVEDWRICGDVDRCWRRRKWANTVRRWRPPAANAASSVCDNTK